ncbi:hypothetical protein SprV_0502003000 [Sparganum proliferum]
METLASLTIGPSPEHDEKKWDVNCEDVVFCPELFEERKECNRTIRRHLKKKIAEILLISHTGNLASRQCHLQMKESLIESPLAPCLQEDQLTTQEGLCDSQVYEVIKDVYTAWDKGGRVDVYELEDAFTRRLKRSLDALRKRRSQPDSHLDDSDGATRKPATTALGVSSPRPAADLIQSIPLSLSAGTQILLSLLVSWPKDCGGYDPLKALAAVTGRHLEGYLGL